MYLKGYKILADILLNTKKLKIDHILIDFYKRQHGKSKMNLKVVFNLINLYLRMIKNFFLIIKLNIQLYPKYFFKSFLFNNDLISK